MIADSLSWQVYLVGGSIPEKDGDKLYNTATIWSPEGTLVGKYRKIHLFDIDVPGKITFKVRLLLGKKYGPSILVCYQSRNQQSARNLRPCLRETVS